MPRAPTQSDHDNVHGQFMNCYNEIRTQKDALLAATSGTDRRRAALAILDSLQELGLVLPRMRAFLAGRWDSNDLKDFSDWAKEIQSMQLNSTLREIIVSLKTFSAQLTTLFDPIQMDEEGLNDSDNASSHNDDSDFEEREPGTGSIRVQPRSHQIPATESSAILDSKTPVIMNPKVSKNCTTKPFLCLSTLTIVPSVTSVSRRNVHAFDSLPLAEGPASLVPNKRLVVPSSLQPLKNPPPANPV